MNEVAINKEELQRKRTLIILISLLVVVLIAICITGLFSIQKEQMKISTISNDSKESGCMTIKAEKIKNVLEYSFDDGKTWQKSNYSVICENGIIEVLGRNKDNQVIAKGNLKIDNLLENYPKINIDFEKTLKLYDDNSLLEGVTAFSNEKNITENILIENKELKDDKLIITYSITDEKGNKTIAKREINDVSNDIEIVSFEKKEYTCKVGEQIKTTITATSTSDKGVNISEYNSNDLTIAEITKNPNLVIKTPSKIAVVIDCKSVGKTKLTSKSSTGAITNATITVKENNNQTEQISFAQPTYTCKVGDKIETTIKATSNTTTIVSIAEYKSNDSTIAAISKNPNLVIKTPSEVAVVIECNKTGTTDLIAKSSTGVTTSVQVKVEETPITNEKISFAKTKYTCKVGEQIKTTITATSSSNLSVNVSEYKSKNTSIATISKNQNEIIKSPNTLAVIIDCKKAGTATLTAKSSTEASTIVKVTVSPVKQPVETIKYANTNYTCLVGEQIETQINATSETDQMVNIQKYASNNESIATIYKNPNIIIRSPSALAVIIDCKKAGTTTLTAKSSTGATTVSTITVKETNIPGETIKFENTSYTCKVGEQIETKINATSETDMMVNIATYSSNNEYIATIYKNPNIIIRSPSALAVIIECKNFGVTTLTTTSSTGAKKSVRIVVQ